MTKIELIGKWYGMRLFLAMMLLSLLSLTVTGAENDNVTLKQINKTLTDINETVDHINATATTPILPMKDVMMILLTLAIVAVACMIIIKIALPKSNSENPPSSLDARCESMGRTITVTFVFLLLVLAAILVKNVILSASDVPPASSVWAAIIILAIVFLLLIYMGCAVDGSLDQGEMRRAIAGTFVLGFTMLIFFLARYEIQNKEVVTAYLQMVGVIVGFYFGAKTALMGTSTGTSDGLAVEFVEVSEDKKNIILTVRNKGDNKLMMDRGYVTGKYSDKASFTEYLPITGITIDPKTSAKITLKLDKALESPSIVKIKVVANTGLADEKEHRVS